jgi:2,4-dienoyl-CoA reductase-like NADH-dependent reductase (Old Yellow Enzyme family)
MQKQNLFAPQKMNFMRAFDVELHATNGYLLEEFYRVSNIRRDCCGSIVNRYRFIIEVVTEIAEAIYKQSNLVRRFKMIDRFILYRR